MHSTVSRSIDDTSLRQSCGHWHLLFPLHSCVRAGVSFGQFQQGAFSALQGNVNVMTGPRLQHYLVSMPPMDHWCWNNRDSAKSRRSNLCPSLCDIISFPKTYPKSLKLHVCCSLEHNKATNQSHVSNRCLWREKLEFTYATSAG